VARTSVEGQQTEVDAEPDRPADLWQPVDDGEDHGARGIFGDEEGGMLTREWLSGVPAIAADATRSVVARAGEVVRARRDSRERPPGI
jgi:hypothetical protein